MNPKLPAHTIDRKPPIIEQTRRKCTKIYPCYIVLTDVAHLIGHSHSASFRFIRSLKKTECPNMCKKMYFRRRLKAGRNVFNVKTPSFVMKRLKYLEKMDAKSPSSSKSDFTSIKYPHVETPKSDSVVYPHMFLNKGRVEYSFEESMKEKRIWLTKPKSKRIPSEKELRQRLKSKTESENIKEELQTHWLKPKIDNEKIKQELERKKIKDEEQEERDRLARERELRKQLTILFEQIKIKRAENFHKKAMRKSKQELPYFKSSVSARSGRVIKPSAFLTDSDYALNSADIIGYRKLSQLHEKQRKALAAMKQKQNMAKRINRVVEQRTLKQEKMDNFFQDVLRTKTPEKPQQSVSAELEIDNPESDLCVRKLEIHSQIPTKPKKKKRIKTEEELDPDLVLKKRKKDKQKGKGDGVIISTMPNTEHVMDFLQKDNTIQEKVLLGQPNTSSYSGAEQTSFAYPYARSLLQASREFDKKEIKPNPMKNAVVLDAKKGKKELPVKFKFNGKDIIATKVGGKLMFFSPVEQVKKETPPNTKFALRCVPNPLVPKTVVTCSVNKPSELLLSTASSSVATSLSGVNTKTTASISKCSTPSQSTFSKIPVTPNIISVPFPFVSVPAATTSYVQMTNSNQSSLSQSIEIKPVFSKPTLIVNPAIRSGFSTFQPVFNTNSKSLLQKTLVASSQITTMASGVAPSTSVLTTLAVSAVVPTSLATSVSLLSPSTVSSSSTISNSVSNRRVVQSLNPNTIAQHAAPKVVVMPNKSPVAVTPQVSTVKPTATVQTQRSDTQMKGKFYLLKVDGKHILIPVPGSLPGTSAQQRAYLVNDSSLSGSILTTINPVTPLPTQTVNLAHTATSSNLCQTLVPCGTNAPIMSYVVKPDGSMVTREPASSVLTLPKPQKAAVSTVVTISSPTVPAPKLAPSVSVTSPSSVSNVGPTVKFLFTPGTTNTVPQVPSISVKPTVNLKDKYIEDDQKNDKKHEDHIKDIRELKQEKNTLADSDKETEKETKKLEPAAEKSQPRPFSEVVTDREERLRKLKELLKQKNEAVEQIRQNLNKTSTPIDGAEI